MLVQRANAAGRGDRRQRPAGNLGVAGAALLTGLLVQSLGWRAAFVVPGVVAIGCGIAFAMLCGPQGPAPARKPKAPSSPCRPTCWPARWSS
jgi:MFS family permease